LIVVLEPVPLLPEGAVAGVVVRADEALIGCNQMLNVFLLAGIFGARQVLFYVQMKL
jgi:hypothetical protein